MPFHKFVCAGFRVVDGKRAVRAGREHADALAVLKALKYNTLHRFAGIKVNFLYDNVLFAGIGNREERRVFTVILNRKRRFIDDVPRISYNLLGLISTRLCIRKPDTAIFIRGVVAQQLTISGASRL